MTTKSKLAIIPEGYKVVPEEPTERMLTAVACCSNDKVDTGGCGNTFRKNIFKNEWQYALRESPQFITPPALRWEGLYLLFYKKELARVSIDPEGFYSYEGFRQIGEFDTLQEARRAAEKAFGLPEIEEV